MKPATARRPSLVQIVLIGGGIVAIPIAAGVHEVVGSGHGCEGIGFGCTPERMMDTALVLLVYAVGLAVASIVALRAGSERVLGVGVVLTLLATGIVTWAQRPQSRHAEGPLDEGLARWQRVVDAGRAEAPPGSDLAAVLGRLQRTGPTPCEDGYGRETGAFRYAWQASGPVYSRQSDAVQRWGARLEEQGLRPLVELEGGADSLTLGYTTRPANGATLSVRVRAYAGKLDIAASTGCHLP